MTCGVIFDMDGLLLDSETYWERARREYCRSHGCDWTAQDELAAKGKNSPEWADLIKERCHLDSSRQEIIRGVAERMRQRYQRRLPLLPGAVSVVETLGDRFPLGLASSSPSDLIEYVLRKAGIWSRFAAVVSADEVGRGKPAPDVFLTTADRMRCRPADVVVFEDSSAGIVAARNAGMRVIAVPNRHYPPTPEALELASLVLPSLRDFREEMLAAMS